MDEEKAMLADIEKCESIIKECISKLNDIKFDSTNGAFLEGMRDVIRTVKMAAFYNYGYQGCPCNALDWMKDNLGYYNVCDASVDPIDSEIVSNMINQENDSDDFDDSMMVLQMYIDENGNVNEENWKYDADMDNFLFDDKDIVEPFQSGKFMIRYKDDNLKKARIDLATHIISQIEDHFKKERTWKNKSVKFLKKIIEECENENKK